VEIGLVLPHSGPNASPSFIRDFAQAAEGCGVARLWGVDHVVLPRHTDSLYPLGRQPTPVADNWLSDNLAPDFELVTTLSWVAGLTTTIGLVHLSRSSRCATRSSTPGSSRRSMRSRRDV